MVIISRLKLLTRTYFVALKAIADKIDYGAILLNVKDEDLVKLIKSYLQMFLIDLQLKCLFIKTVEEDIKVFIFGVKLIWLLSIKPMFAQLMIMKLFQLMI